MNAMRRLLVPAGAAAAGAGLALWLWPAPPAMAPLPAAPPAPTSAAPTPATQQAEVRPAAPAQQPVSRLRMPDGTEVEPLNGVKVPAPIKWGDHPYSPIVGTEHGNGIDWYVHADGTRSTTVELMRSDLGRIEPVTLVAHPHAPVLLDPADLAGAGRKQ